MFEQVLIGMLGMDDSDEDRAAKLERAFNKLHDLTDGVRTALLKNRVFESLNAIVEDADVDSIDDELSKAQKAKSDAPRATERTERSNILPLDSSGRAKQTSHVIRK